MFDLPGAFTETDAQSLAAQRLFVRSTRIQLLLLVVAGGMTAFSWSAGGLDVASLVAGFALLTAAGLRLLLVKSGAHRIWYEGRAAAESAKTLSWRYAVGGHPFGVRSPQAVDEFSRAVADVVSELSSVRSPGAVAMQPTSSMEDTRSSDLENRKVIYAAQRIDDQFHWYASKAAWNRQRARFWGILVVVLQVAAAVGAFLKGFDVIGFDLLGLAAAVVGSATAWLEMKQHSNLGSAYGVAADELRRIRSLIAEQESEEQWAQFVGEAEEAISREHAMWKATSTQRQPASLM